MVTKTNPAFQEVLLTLTALFCGMFVLQPFKIKPYSVAVFFAFALYNFFTSKNPPSFEWKKLGAFSGLFVIYVISISISDNLSEAFRIVGRICPIVLIPLGFCLLNVEARVRFSIIFKKTFIVAAVCYSIAIFGYLFYLGYFRHERTLEVCYSFICFEFFGFNDHPIYASAYFAVALLLLLDGVIINRLISIVFVFIALAGLLILARKGVIMAFAGCSAVLITIRNSRRKSLLILALISGLFAVSLLVPEIRNRFLEVLNSDNIVNNSETSSGIRYILWNASTELIDEAKVFGYGVGDVTQVLHRQLLLDGYFEFENSKYNAHNQYLQVCLSAGLLGFCAFLLSQLYFLRDFLKKRDFTGAVFLAFFLTVLFFECFLERQNGVIVYSFVTCIFAFKARNEQNLKR